MQSLDLLLSDTLIPDIFISDYLPGLDGEAVKIYILACHMARAGDAIPLTQIASRLELSVSQIQAKAVPLVSASLVSIDREGQALQVLPIKAYELMKHYRPKTSRTPTEHQARVSHTQRQTMITSIAQTFFHNTMSPSWYSMIDGWFEDYHFTPEVVYALFQECERRGHLRTKAYAESVAKNWHKEGVRTVNDLERYWKSYDQMQGIVGHVKKHMNRPEGLTQVEVEMVNKWVNEWGFSEQMIDEAFARATSASRPTLQYFDSILRRWYDAQIDTPEKVQHFDQAFMQRKADAQEIAKVLGRRNLAQAEMDAYSSWREELGYSHDTILRMIRELSKRSRQGVSIHYVDTVIRKYYAEGLTSPEAIGQYEKARREGYNPAGDKPGAFTERTLDDAYVASIYQYAWDAIAGDIGEDSDAK